MKLLFCFGLWLSSAFLCFSQADSLAKNENKKHLYVSATAGVPVYNTFGYKYNVSQDHYNKSNSKSKIVYGLNFDFDFNHFTMNVLANYSQNDFSGNSYKLPVAQLNSGSHQVPIYKYYEIYQKVKYDYLQLGTGLGYNRWFKRHHITITTNIMFNIVNSIRISSYYTPDSKLNDRDTSNVHLAKNQKSKDVHDPCSIYANLQLAYSYSLTKRAMVCFSVNTSFGIFDNIYSSSGSPFYDNYDFAYTVYYQKVIYPSIGLKYKIYNLN